MGKLVDKERAQAFAKDALAWMSFRGIPPTPENFELVYAYVGVENPELKRTMDGLIDNGCKFEPSVMSILHQRYFRAPRNDDAIADVTERMTEELQSVTEMLESATRDQSTYGSTLSAASGELDSGKLEAPGIKKLISNLVNATHTMEARSKLLEKQLQSSSREVTDLQEALELARREVVTDQLTGISNRKAFDADLNNAVEKARDSGEPLALIMCDIDRFKAFNDNWGHQTGDQVLRLVASCLMENVKGRDTAARYGGEEFAVVLPQTDLNGALNLADQLRAKVESKKLVKKSTGDILGVITISAGVAQWRPGESIEALIQRADAALYAAKGRGRNRVVAESDKHAAKLAGAAA